MFRIARALSSKGAAVATVAAALAVLTVSTASGGGAPVDVSANAVAGADGIGVAAVAPANPEAVYTAVAPCRIVDTRTAGGALTVGAARNFRAAGTTGFVGQGGKSGGCGIPSSATAVAASVKSIDGSGEGYLRIWAAGTSEPSASMLTYSGANVGDMITLPIRVPSPSSTHFNVRPYNASTHLVVDVVGYFAPQIHARVTNAGVLDWATPRVISASKIATGTYQVDVDRTVAGCAATASVHGGTPYYTSTALTGSLVVVYVWTAAGTAADAYFYLDVAC